jgi:hypothetical protein
MSEDHRPRLDRIEEALAGLAEDVAATDAQVRTLVRLHEQSSRDIARLYEMWNEASQDIRRLYNAWPDHLRNGHS